jgi:predicted nucleotide-binding protein (sugar kinase/HSP70/actin superfamily)
MPPVAKAKKKVQRQAEIAELMNPKAARKAERKLRNFIMELDERSEAREEYTQSILAVNDRSVLETVSAIAESLLRMSPYKNETVVVLDGRTYQVSGAEADLVRKIQMRNFRYIAIRLLVACAEWNIRVGNFNLPSDSCARCGKEV